MTPSFPVNTQSRRWMSTVLACFHPFLKPESFDYEITSPNTFQLKCDTWGDIGQLICEANRPENSSLRFVGPALVSPEEALKYYEILGVETLGYSVRIHEADNRFDLIAQRCVEPLQKIRLARHSEFKTWLGSRLRIFGYYSFYIDHALKETDALDESFEFPLQGKPAQFGAMIDEFIQTLHSHPDFQKLGANLTLPTGRKDTGSLPSDANPVALKLTQGRSQCYLHVHLVPSGGSRLRVHLKGSKDLWKLWDEIRDELVRLGWYTFPEVPEVQETPVASQPDPVMQIQAQGQVPEVEKWMSIPDVGTYREIVRLWHAGNSYKQIGARLSLSPKTIQNKVDLLRKQYGVDIAPLRRAKTAKNKHEDQSRDIDRI